MKSIIILLIIFSFLIGCNNQNKASMEVPVEIEFTKSDLEYFNKLSEAELNEIDSTIYSHTKVRWQKIAMVIAKSLDLREKYPELNDVKLLVRVHYLINSNKLESEGNIKAMRFSEVRRK